MKRNTHTHIHNHTLTQSSRPWIQSEAGVHQSYFLFHPKNDLENDWEKRNYQSTTTNITGHHLQFQFFCLAAADTHFKSVQLNPWYINKNKKKKKKKENEYTYIQRKNYMNIWKKREEQSQTETEWKECTANAKWQIERFIYIQHRFYKECTCRIDRCSALIKLTDLATNGKPHTHTPSHRAHTQHTNLKPRNSWARDVCWAKSNSP